MNQRKFYRLSLLAAFLSVGFLASSCSASKTQSTASAGGAEKAEKKDGTKSIKEVTKNAVPFEGLFTIYQDTTNGTAYLQINKDQIGKEFIYFSHVANGVLDAGYFFRGAYRGSKIFSIQRYFDKIEFVLENTNYYFDENSAISKAADANINRPVVFSQKIAAQNEDKTAFLVKADDVFLSEIFDQVKPSPDPSSKGKGFSLGNMSKDKNKYIQIKNYPENTDVVVEYVYENPYPTSGGSSALTDPRFVSVKVQHSLIEVPDNDFQPRFDDPRVGYFTQYVNDMTSTSVTPYRDIINRWNLVKKDPNAALSEPVEPITWWIENTTPVELRETIRDGVLKWNEAFEAAGFKNAVVVKIQPDDAEWDAGDIRYNVLRWTSSPNPPFGGYGPSFVNPRTGQILGADVMLEYVFLTNRVKYENLYNGGQAAEMDAEHMAEGHMCMLPNYLQMSNMFGTSALKALGDPNFDTERSELLKESVYYLVLHEVGHTMGLNHNMKSSQLHSPENLNNKALTSKVGLTGSVMEYPAINVASDRSKQGLYYTTKPGPYDLWAIEYGYSPALESADAEAKRLEKILSKSHQPELAFGNDADDMRSSSNGIDPRVMIGDLSSDAITYSVDRMALVNKTMPKIIKNLEEGESYHQVLSNYAVLFNEYATAAGIITRYVGGVYVDRSFVGQNNKSKPLTPVSYADQKRAMKALNDNVFAPNAYDVPNDLYNYLQVQRRGFSLFGKNEDPKIHDNVLALHKTTLSHLLHPKVLKRISDSEMYGNEYSLSEMMTDLTNAIFVADAKGSVNSFRQNLQLEYVERLAKILDADAAYTNLAQSMAIYELNRVRKMVAGNSSGDTATKAHRQHLTYKIDKAMEVFKKG